MAHFSNLSYIFVESTRVCSRFDTFGQLVLLGDASVVLCLILMLIVECFMMKIDT
jgi:hypothetical protein